LLVDELDSSSEFSDTSSSFHDSSLKSSVSESGAEDNDEERAETECSLIVNGEKHQRQKLMVRVSLRPKRKSLYKQQME